MGLNVIKWLQFGLNVTRALQIILNLAQTLQVVQVGLIVTKRLSIKIPRLQFF